MLMEKTDVVFALEQALEEAQEKQQIAEERIEALVGFLAKISHDMRTAMNAISGLSYILATSDPLSEKQRQYIDTLQSSSKALLALVTQLTDVTKQVVRDEIAADAPDKVSSLTDKKSLLLCRASKNILLVEDYPANVLVATTLLEQLGYSYDVATNGVEALDKMQKTHYQLVLMDLEMEGLHGLEVTQKIRHQEAKTNSSRIPIIGMTAHALFNDRERCLLVGMDDYIAKPFGPDELKKKLEQMLQG